MQEGTKPRTTICAGPTNNPMNGLRYRVVIEAERVLDSAIIERSYTDYTLPTGATPSSAVPPFQMLRSTPFPMETRMENTAITRMPDNPNFARVTASVVMPLDLDLMDTDGIEFHTRTNYTYDEDIILYVPQESTFPFEIRSEASTVSTGGVSNRNTTTISKFCVRIVTRVIAQADLLIPSYGYAPINPATTYEDATCRNFFNQPLYPNGRANENCYNFC
ncbi:MAG: hypothetical protein LBH47_03175 [Christensenellaceae bacterium]|jgi:hypothetical protein|nr:hypothetical protein [Christensenellaceae bacterium]